MGLRVVLVAGPRKSGKGAIIRAMIDLLWQHRPHYMRLARTNGDKKPPSKLGLQTPEDWGLASARWLMYDDDLIFERLPAALTQIHASDRYGSVVVEADSDPIVRNAYAFDHRVFVMPMPSDLDQIFRTPEQAAAAMHAVLKDTTAFASEVFGLIDQGRLLSDGECHEKPDLSATQWRGFLYSPLGEELITRILLQPPYHGLAESDVVIINTGVGARSCSTAKCISKLDCLLRKISALTQREVRRFACDLYAEPTSASRELLEVLAPMCQGGR
ncbi:MAG: hypothetical protein FLDDKLPJ_02677 [Phycisphaerae bacterium]|nr:hypothetical protein [Phycisphaerae bacterium]